MVFWGLEVKPGKAVPYDSEAVPGRLHITQATLGNGSSNMKNVLQCVVGDNSPIFLCSLLPDKTETCALNLEFEDDGVVSFSTTGPRSIHLSGFIETDGHDGDDFETDSYGEDIAESDTDESTDYNTDDSFGEGFTDEDDDLVMYPPSPIPKSGVVIEEIVDDEKPATENKRSKHSKKKGQLSGNGDSDASQKQIVVKHTSGVPMSESEDEDGFPVSVPTKSKVKKQGSIAEETVENKSKNSKKKRSRDETSSKIDNTPKDQQKREEKKPSDSSVPKGGAIDNNDQPKKRKKDTNRQIKKADGAQTGTENNNDEVPVTDDKSKSETEMNPASGDHSSEKKKRKKKKKNKAEKTVEKIAPAVEKETEEKNTQVREFPNGLVIEEIKMGKPDGKRASPGKRVSVNYIGKLKKNGSIFDSNVGRAPIKFRLGIGEVIKGWDVGINGMRVGDKRRLTIPPVMGYGAAGADHKIPPNSWLVFDVELLNVN
ncbi:hypothetical protein QQ045_007414 [Rhodiola kirilowii]